MPELVIASHNVGKVREFVALLDGFPVRVVSAQDAGIVAFPPETGETFAANARTKAMYVTGLTGRAAIADDSGLAVDALGGAPGLYSARFSGEGASDVDRCKWVLTALESVPPHGRTARFIAAIAVSLPNGTVIEAEGRLEGAITDEGRGTNGFGYDPIFVVGGTDRTLAEMPDVEKNAISHRAVAFAALRPHLLAVMPQLEPRVESHAEVNDIDLTITRAIDDFLTTMRKSPHTVTTYGYGLRKFAAFLAAEGLDVASTSVTSLTTAHVVDFSGWLLPLERQTREEVGAARTALTYCAAVRKFYKHLVANDLHPTLSLEKMGLQLAAQQTGFAAPPPDVRTRDLDRILQFLATQPRGEKPETELRRLKVAALIRFLYRTGTRVSECCALRRGDIDLEDGTAFVFRGKGGKSRRVYFDSGTADALTRYWTARLDGSQPVALASLPAFSGRDFPGKPGNRITVRSVERIVNDVARQAGIAAHVTPHTFRHGLATQLVEGKVPAPVVQRVLGHANLATTQVYVHLVDAEVRAEYQEAFGEYRPASADATRDESATPPAAAGDS